METVNTSGVRLATIDEGLGTGLLFVHGFPLDHTMWNSQVTYFADRYRVIAPDLRGFGGSEVTPDTTSMEQFADDLNGLLDVLGVDEPIVLCGLSMGGYVALAFANKYAGRLRGLVLCDTRSGPDTPEAAEGRRAAADNVLIDGPMPMVTAMLPKLFSESTFEAHSEAIDLTREVILATDPQGIASAARGMADRPDSTPGLAAISCPTLLVVGAHDVITPPEEMRTMAKTIPNGRLTEIPNAGHMSPLEKPAEVNAAIAEFLEELRA